MANEITGLPLFEGKAIRTEIAEDGSVLFCAKDVCDILGYKDAQAAVRRWVGKRAICPVGGFKARIKPMSFAVAEVVRFANGGAK